MLLADTPRRGEQGFSLLESVVAIAVLGIIVSAMVGGMATSIATSNTHRQQSVANVVMVSAAETVKNAAYVRCASTYPTPLQPSAQTTVEFWNPQLLQWQTSPCHDISPSGDGLGGLFPMQRVKIAVTPAGSSVSTSVYIIKRGP